MNEEKAAACVAMHLRPARPGLDARRPPQAHRGRTDSEGEEGMIKTGDKVCVHPLDDAGKSAIGTVMLLSENQRSIAVAFADSVPFAISGAGMAVYPEHGIILLAHREIIDGFEEPWAELFAQGQFEIKAAP